MKRGYKSYYVFLIITIIIIFVGLFKVLEIKDVDISQIHNVISEKIDLDIMNEDDGTNLRKLYNINKHDIEDFIYYSPKSNMDASEILIIKPKSESDIKSIETKVKARLNKQSDSFQNYNKEQYDILKNHILEEKSGYIILIVSSDAKKIRQAINIIF